MSNWILWLGSQLRKSLSTPNTTPKKESEEISEEELKLGGEFLLAEFENLRVFIQRSEDFISRSADVLTALVTALGAGLALLSQTSHGSREFLYVSVFAIGTVLSISLIAFHQSIKRDVQATNYIRAMNRIRAYFAHRLPHIRPYLIMPITHNYPRYGSRSRGREVIIALNSLMLSTLIVMIDLLLGKVVILDAHTFILGSVSFVIITSLQIIYSKVLFFRAEKKSRKYQTKDEELLGSYVNVRV